MGSHAIALYPEAIAEFDSFQPGLVRRIALPGKDGWQFVEESS